MAKDEKTKLEVLRAQLKASGISITEWADKHRFSAGIVYAVLQGKNKATRGESFRIAVALGLKDRPPIEDAPEFIKKILAAQEPEDPNLKSFNLEEMALEKPTEFCHQRLANERRKAGLNTDELASLAGVSRATQYNYESGNTPLTLEYLGKIQDIIDVRTVLFDDSGRIK